MRHIFSLSNSVAASSSTPAYSASVSNLDSIKAIDTIQTHWAQALRCDCGRSRDAMLCRLAEQTQELVFQYPNDAKVLLWNGIVLTGYAKSLGGLCALQFQAQAKTSLERATALAPNDGAAYLYLGLLYDHSPTSPFGFGDEKMAKVLLEKGLNLTLSASHCVGTGSR